MMDLDEPALVVLAGGEGRRLLSLTRAIHGEDLPKQYATLWGNRSLLAQTVERALELGRPEDTFVVVAEERAALAVRQLQPFVGVHSIAQPDNRGTLPGILLGLLHVTLERGEDAPVVFLPSDHFIPDGAAFTRDVRKALRLSETHQAITLLGAVPSRVDSEYGYILPVGPGELREHVLTFVEKPSPEEAAQLLLRGALWNTFVMVGSVRQFWRQCFQHAPRVTEAFARLLRLPRAERARALRALYSGLPDQDFSKQVLERAAPLLVSELRDSGWSDWGTPERVFESLRGLRGQPSSLERVYRGRRSEGGGGAHAPAEAT